MLPLLLAEDAAVRLAAPAQPLWVQAISLALAGLGVVALVGLLWRGKLSAAELRRGPQRRVDLSPITLAVAVGMMIFGLLAVSLLMGMAANLMPGLISVDPQNNSFVIDHPALEAAAMIFMQLALQGPAAVMLLVLAAAQPLGLRRLGFVPRRPLREVKWSVWSTLIALPVVALVSVVVMLAYHLLGQPLDPIAHDTLNKLITSDSAVAVGLMLVAVVILAPLLEELLYRGLLQTVLLNLLGRDSRWAVVLLASGVFALIHLSAVPYYALPMLFTFGVALGYTYERTGSLWPCIVTHAAFNGFNVVQAMLLAG